jgi:hypothetical protein
VLVIEAKIRGSTVKFWVFERQMMAGPWAFADNVDPVKYGEAPRCPSCGAWIGMKPWLPPYRVRLVEGTKTAAPADIITGPGFSGFIASDRFATEFESNGLTGVERWEPVHIEGYNDYEGDPIPAQAVVNRPYKLAILPTPITRVKLSDAVYEDDVPDCAVCSQGRNLESYQGFVVDETSWLGADVFETTNTGRTVVTDRFADFCHAGEFTGVLLIPTANFEPGWSKRLRGAT